MTLDTNKLALKLARDLPAHFDELVQSFQQPLFAYAYSMAGSPEDAEEVVQDVFTRAFRALETYESDRIRSMSLKAWLYRICVNQMRNRRRGRRLTTTSLPDELGSTDGSRDPIAAEYERTEGDLEMRELVTRLPRAYRAPVLLRFVNDLSYAEIAETLDQPEGTVKSSVHRGLKLLRNLIEHDDRHSLPAPLAAATKSPRISGESL